MKILKNILIAIAVFIALVLIVAFFTKKDFTVEKEITIDKPKQVVFDYVKLLRNSVYYNKWAMADPTAKQTFTGTDGTPGFVYAWKSEKDEVGQGEQEIVHVSNGDSLSDGRVDYQLRFIKPFEGKAESHITMIPVNANQTTVKWRFSSEMIYPMNIMLLFIKMEDVLGKDLEVSLSNLKQITEKH